MHRFSFLAVGLSAWSCLAFSTGSPTKVDTKKFFQAIHGSYEIQLAGGKAPKPENALADVSADPTEVFFTLPYCEAGGLCDPGYLTLAYGLTEVVEETLSNGDILWTISDVSDPTVPDRFPLTWKQSGDTYTFTNPTYTFGGTTRKLEHVLKKAP